MGFEPERGIIRDVHGSATGTAVGGRVLVMDRGRGSSSASTALAESIRLGTAPAAIILGEVDEILVVGSMVAQRLYDLTCPIVLLGNADRSRIVDGQPLAIQPDGAVQLG